MSEITFTSYSESTHTSEQGTPFVISVVTNASASSIVPVVTSQLPPPPPPPSQTGGFNNLNYYSTAYVSHDSLRSRKTTLTTKGVDDAASGATREIKLKVFNYGSDNNVYFKVDQTLLSTSFDTFKIVHGSNETDVLTSTVNNGKIQFNLPRMTDDTTEYILKYKTKTNVVAGIDSFTDKAIDPATTTTFYENTAADTVLFTFTATSTDGQEYTTEAIYTIVSGNTAGHFKIVGNQVKTTITSVDYETPTVSITLGIKASMGGAEVVKDYTITVNNVNETPSTITFTPIADLKTDHTGSIGTLATTDPDAGDTHTYEISGSHTDKFVIANNNEVHVNTGATLVADTSYGFTIKSTDVEQLSVTVNTFTYTFSSANAAPTEITFTEESGLNTDHTGKVGTLATTDADVEDTHTYTLVTTGGDPHATLEIGGENSDEVHVKTGASLTADTTYTFKITTEDGNGGTYSKEFSVTFSAAASGDVTQTITLIPGWNMIALQVTLSNNSFRVWLSDAIDDIKTISQWIDGGYKSFTPSTADMWQNFLEFAPGYGAWVQVKAGSPTHTIEISGPQSSRVMPAIVPVWNLIGFPLTEGVLFRTSLSDAIDDIETVSQWIDGGYKAFTPSTADMWQNFLSFVPGHGAWIKMKQGGTSTTITF